MLTKDVKECVDTINTFVRPMEPPIVDRSMYGAVVRYRLKGSNTLPPELVKYFADKYFAILIELVPSNCPRLSVW